MQGLKYIDELRPQLSKAQFQFLLKRSHDRGETVDRNAVMTTQHPRWREFVERLEGPEGCNFRERLDDNGEPIANDIVWDCTGQDKGHATKILSTMEGIDIVGTLAYFEDHGGYCDCEILFNVVDWDEAQEQGTLGPGT